VVHYEQLIQAEHQNQFSIYAGYNQETVVTYMMHFHAKTLACILAAKCATDTEMEMSDLFDKITEEMYEMGDDSTPLDHKISMWHETRT
jgi:hypothetical protein